MQLDCKSPYSNSDAWHKNQYTHQDWCLLRTSVLCEYPSAHDWQHWKSSVIHPVYQFQQTCSLHITWNTVNFAWLKCICFLTLKMKWQILLKTFRTLNFIPSVSFVCFYFVVMVARFLFEIFIRLCQPKYYQAKVKLIFPSQSAISNPLSFSRLTSLTIFIF